jgi:signal peptidase I
MGPTDAATGRRRPWLALLLGLVQPGLGQLYAGDGRRAITWFVGLIAWAYAARWSLLNWPGGWTTALSYATVPLGLAAAVDAFFAARRAPRPFALRAYNRWYVYAAAIVVAWAASVPAGRFLEAFRMPSGSMEPTILLGDWFYADKRPQARRALTHGGLVLYASPDDRSTVVKRVVGLPGDTLLMRADTLVRNGTTVDEPYMKLRYSAGVSATPQEDRTWGPLVVPRDSLFVLGDDRHASKDSRHVGFIALADVLGTPRVVYYSYDPEGDMPLPYVTAIRWDRLGLQPR